MKKQENTNPRVQRWMRESFDEQGRLRYERAKEIRAEARAIVSTEGMYRMGDTVDGHDVHGALVVQCFPMKIENKNTRP